MRASPQLFLETASITSTFHTITRGLLDLRGMAAMSVPALCFVFQNFMMFVALSNLDVATSQVTYQPKLLTTAVFAMIMLGRTFTRTQWAAQV